MRMYLAFAPWWILSLYFGLFFGVSMGAFSWATGPRDLLWISLSAGIGGVIFGGFMGPYMARVSRRHRAATGDLSPHDFKAAYRATVRGPVPADPQVRAAAARAANHSLSTTLKQRTFAIVVFSAFTLLSLVLALQTPWWLLAAAEFGFFLAGQWYWPRRLRRRIKLLSEGGDLRGGDPAAT